MGSAENIGSQESLNNLNPSILDLSESKPVAFPLKNKSLRPQTAFVRKVKNHYTPMPMVYGPGSPTHRAARENESSALVSSQS